MTVAEASVALRDLYGIEPLSLDLLETERDDTYRVQTASRQFVFKIAHPDDDALTVNLQTAAMSYVAEDPTLPVQSLVFTVEGDVEPVIVHAGRDRVARLMTWLDGDLLETMTPTSDELVLLGATLGRLSDALSTFVHPAAQRTFAWDLQSFAQLRDLAHPDAANAVFDRLAELDLDALPHQVIHNDFHPGNVLATRADPRFVVGILDFGDVLHSARVVDVGVSLAYLVPEEGDPAAVIEPFVAGFDSVVALLPAERDAINTLLAARLVQRIVLATSAGVDPAIIARTTRILDTVLSTHPQEN